MKINQFIVFTLIFISIQQTCYTQVGINQDNPNDSAILHISSDSKGVLFPAPVVDKINNNKKDGLFYYNSEEKRFYHYNKNLQSWQCVNPFNAKDTNNIKAPGNLSVDTNLEVQQNLTVKKGKLTVKGGNIEVENDNKFKGYGTTPIGGIIMWSGSINEIPDGWALCDGKTYNGKQTPDLRGRFIVGYSKKYNNENVNNETYDTNYDIKSPLDTTYEHKRSRINLKTGDTTWLWVNTESCNLNLKDCRIDTITGGNRINNAINDDYTQIGLIDGERKHKLTAEESALPEHNHSINHNHNITDPGHAHDIRIGRNGGNGQITKEDKHNKGYKTTENSKTGISVDTYSGNSGNKKVSKATTAHENRPPYYVMAFIMRVK